MFSYVLKKSFFLNVFWQYICLAFSLLFLESVKSYMPGTTNKDIEDNIKIWLKHAPDRLKNKIQRNQRQNNQNVEPNE